MSHSSLVVAFLERDRQWPRHCRITHARLKFSQAKTRGEADFWSEILEANGAHNE